MIDFLFLYMWISIWDLFQPGYLASECMSARHWPSDMKNSMKDGTLGLPFIGGKRCPERKLGHNNGVWKPCGEGQRRDMQRDEGTKKGELSPFSVANRFHSHSCWAMVSMLWQTNSLLFVAPSLCNCTPASFSHRPDLSSWLWVSPMQHHTWVSPAPPRHGLFSHQCDSGSPLGEELISHLLHTHGDKC